MGAEANFLDERFICLFKDVKRIKLEKPVIAKSALRGQKQIDLAVEGRVTTTI